MSYIFNKIKYRKNASPHNYVIVINKIFIENYPEHVFMEDMNI